MSYVIRNLGVCAIWSPECSLAETKGVHNDACFRYIFPAESMSRLSKVGFEPMVSETRRPRPLPPTAQIPGLV